MTPFPVQLGKIIEGKGEKDLISRLQNLHVLGNE